MEINAGEMDSIVKQLGRWISLMQQVHEAQHFIEQTEKIAHPQNFQTLDGLLEILVYFRGALNSYGKCFIGAGHGKRVLARTGCLEATRIFWSSTPELWSCVTNTLRTLTTTRLRGLR
jgi:hypothetical protein